MDTKRFKDLLLRKVRTSEGVKTVSYREFISDIHFLPEMEVIEIERAENWTWNCPSNISDSFDLEWANLIEKVKNKVSSEKVRELSLWAKDEMKNYEYYPSIMPFGFSTLGCTDSKIAYSTNLDYLPSHSPLVTRKLQVIVVADIDSSIEESEVFVTIRGQVEE